MKLPSLFVLASLALIGATTARAADATSPVDYTQRNAPYEPTPSVAPGKKAPETNSSVQEKRVDKTILDKKPAVVGERRAAIDVQESREKIIHDKDSRRPEKIEQPMSTFNHREATISTGAETTTRPEMVAKYQDSLTSASATNMARFPAISRATGAKINRFVFRKNAPDTAAALTGAAITPAAGGAAVRQK